MPERNLYYIPIVHSSFNQKESFGVEDANRERQVDATYERFFKGVDRFTKEVLPQDLQGFRLYMDGYDSTSVSAYRRLSSAERRDFLTRRVNAVVLRQKALQENDILTYGAPSKILFLEEYVLCDLADRGGVLVQAENDRLVGESKRIREMLRRPVASAGLVSNRERLEKQFSGLCRQREDAIVSAVHKDLNPSRTGILFLGADHDIVDRLKRKGISVTIPTEVFDFVTQSDIDATPGLRQFKAKL